MLFQQNLCWDSHIHHILEKASGRLWQFHRLRSSLNSRAMLYLYRSYIRPIVEYASLAYSSLSTTLSDCLERFKRKAERICLRLPLFTPVQHSSLLHHAELPTLSSVAYAGGGGIGCPSTPLKMSSMVERATPSPGHAHMHASAEPCWLAVEVVQWCTLVPLCNASSQSYTYSSERDLIQRDMCSRTA